MTLSYDVALGNQGEQDHNTIVFSGVDITVPLEMDLDNDPLQDDEVRLKSLDGLYEAILLASDPEVKPDTDRQLLLYTFRNVPPGAYRIGVRISDEEWMDVVVGLIVSKTGASLGGKTLGTKPDAVKPHEPAPAPKDEASEPLEPGKQSLGEFVDVNDAYVEER